MVDDQARRKLGQDLRQLVAGTITNDDFDDAQIDVYCDSQDAAVRLVSWWGWSLYSDSHRYRLRGRNRVDAATRRIAARCVLFLRDKREYEWPAAPSTALADVSWTLACYGIPAGIAVLLCCAMLLASRTKDVAFMVPIGIAASAWLAWSVWFRVKGYRRAMNSPEWRAWQACGDYDVWPFFRREDFYAARRTHHLLGSRLTMTRDSST
jgi:hypothetical protein